MKFYAIRSTATTTKEFIVRAENNAEAVNTLLTANNENVQQTAHTTCNSTEVAETTYAAWQAGGGNT